MTPVITGPHCSMFQECFILPTERQSDLASRILGLVSCVVLIIRGLNNQNRTRGVQLSYVSYFGEQSTRMTDDSGPNIRSCHSGFGD